jgi:hypothetical protein
MTKYIDQIREVTDLEDGECAMPEADRIYVSYPMAPDRGVQLPVVRIERRGDCILAISVAGVERCIAGDNGTAKFCIRSRVIEKRKRR